MVDVLFCLFFWGGGEEGEGSFFLFSFPHKQNFLFLGNKSLFWEKYALSDWKYMQFLNPFLHSVLSYAQMQLSYMCSRTSWMLFCSCGLMDVGQQDLCFCQVIDQQADAHLNTLFSTVLFMMAELCAAQPELISFVLQKVTRKTSIHGLAGSLVWLVYVWSKLAQCSHAMGQKQCTILKGIEQQAYYSLHIKEQFFVDLPWLPPEAELCFFCFFSNMF